MAKEPIELSLEDQLKQLEIEERKQALESKRIQDELFRIQLSEKKQELETKKNNKARGRADAERAIEDLKMMQERCNHHTGGEGAVAVMQGQGDLERPTCIGAQQFLDDVIRLRCMRCGAEARSNDKDRVRWGQWVGLWRRSVNKQIMVVGGLKITKQPQVAL